MFHPFYANLCKKEKGNIYITQTMLQYFLIKSSDSLSHEIELNSRNWKGKRKVLIYMYVLTWTKQSAILVTGSEFLV